MRGILNIAIMFFVIWAVWYQVKSHNFPALDNYVQSIKSSFNSLMDEAKGSFGSIFDPLKNLGTNSGITSGLNLDTITNTTSFGSLNLDSLNNLVNVGLNSGTAPSTAGGIPSPITAITDQLKKKIDAPEKIFTTQTTPGALTISGVISSTNSNRAQNGQGALKESSRLDVSALVKAKDILNRQYFEHVAPDGKTVSDLAIAEGYTYIKIGENLALGNFKDDADLVTAWMNSPGHKANILDSAYTEMGVGIAYGTYKGREVSVAVQHFGRPRSDCPSISSGLKSQVEAGQAELDKLSASLETMKNQIEEGRAQNKDMNDLTIMYNTGVDKYNALFKTVEAERLQYNAQVSSFNSCIGAS